MGHEGESQATLDPMQQTLGTAFDPRHNSIGFLRLCLSSSVLVSHAYILGGIQPEPLVGLTNGQEGFGSLGVAGFFVLSGFLIAASFERSPSIWRYLWHRVLRIMPAFWVCLVVTAFGLGPLMWLIERGTLAGYLDAPGGPVSFVVNNFGLEYRQSSIACLPRDAAIPGLINGSLWTLWPEFLCYLGLGALGLAGVLRWRLTLLVAIVAIMWASWVTKPFGADIAAFRWGATFGIGSLAWLGRDHIPISGRLALGVAVALAAAIALGVYVYVGYPLVAYLLLWAAAWLPFQGVGRRVDLSYGIYIYAFPVEQLLAIQGVGSLGPAIFIALALALTLPLAAASWFLIERRALALKGWTPGGPGRRSADLAGREEAVVVGGAGDVARGA